MHVDLSRGALRLTQENSGEIVMPLTKPINDLIGLRPELPFIGYLFNSYSPFWPREWFDVASRLQADEPAGRERPKSRFLAEMDRAVKRWAAAGLARSFLDAATLAESGHFFAKLAPHFERITRRPGDVPDEVPDGDLPALASWALDQALCQLPLKLVRCPRCQIPWLTSLDQQNLFCLRPAPGLSTSCRTLERDRDEKSPYRREYKRLHERTRRKTLTEEAFSAWNAENVPGVKGTDWLPYDEWQQRRWTSQA